MRTLPLLILAICCHVTLAQAQAKSQLPAGVEVSTPAWREVQSWVDEDRTGLQAPAKVTGPSITENDGKPIPEQINPPGRRKTLYAYDLSFELKNSGAKAIRYFEWEYFWTGGGKVESNQRKSDKRVAAGEKVKVKVRYVPSKLIESGFHYPAGMERPAPKVRIKRIEYADGTSWEGQ